MTVDFVRCLQGSQEYGGDNQHMIARVIFNARRDGETTGPYHADLKQVVGDDFETGGIEVSHPQDANGRDLPGAFSHAGFREAATDYYRSLVGSQGSVFQIENSSGIVFEDTALDIPQTVTFEVPDTADVW